MAAEEKVAAEERVREAEAEWASERASERATRTRLPSVEVVRPAKRPRREAKAKPKDNKAADVVDYAESTGFTCEGCAM